MKTWELMKKVEHRLNEAVCLITPEFKPGDSVFIYEVKISQKFVTVRFSVQNVGDNFEWTFDIEDVVERHEEVCGKVCGN